MVYKFLSNQFYVDYPHNLYPELESKHDRPYAIVCITINNHTFALPLRSHITHKFAYFSDKTNKCGIDFSKAVYIAKQSYIDNTVKPYIGPNEFSNLKGKEYIIKKKFLLYMENYVKAQESHDPNKMRDFQFSTLNYFEDIINYKNDILIPLKKTAVPI